MAKDYKGSVEYSIEIVLEKIESLLKADYYISKRTIATLLLEDDEEIKTLVRKKDSNALAKIDRIVEDIKSRYVNPVSYELALERQNAAKEITKNVVSQKKKVTFFREKLSHLLMNPITGFPILFLVLYWGLYKFVGGFGAGTVVDFLESGIFENHVNPFMENIFLNIIPWQVLYSLFMGEYGLITLGLRYAIAIILPIVTFFFLIFSVIEDTGYLPRLALLIDKTFKKIGLSGRAVIPMALGFGCSTMATMVTRTLPTKRERIISTMLLALAIPCSAQLGIILAILGSNPKAMFVWAGVVWFMFLFIGYLTAKILPGDRPSFYMEVPPLRLPNISNILTKTYVRVKWYLKEVIPLFLLASIFIWVGKLLGVFDFLIKLLEKPVNLIGLPSETAKVFLFGFFRRDYGAAGLYDINKQGLLGTRQLIVSCIALTLFLPCIAQFLINIKERGFKVGLSIAIFVLFFSFTVSWVVNFILLKFSIFL